MKMRSLAAAALLWLGIGAGAQAQTFVVASCPAGTAIAGAGQRGLPYAVDVNGNVCMVGGTTTGIASSSVTVTTPSVPTPGTFVNVLQINLPRKACTVTNIGTTQGYCNALDFASNTTSKSMPVSANGGQFSCTSPGGGPPASNAISCTCASGTCSFVVNEQ